MDAVITYVDGLDPIWQAEYASAVGGEILAKRYRDWGTLRYLLRGIEKHIPSVENVYLLVSGISQVPAWIDKDQVRVVLHKEIIPEVFLPTFNSTTIEMFMHRIPGLDEQFIYFNDDMFPVLDCSPEDFFRIVQRILIVVDLPAPFSPRNANSSPSPTSNEMPFTAVRSSYFFVRFFTEIAFFIFFILLLLSAALSVRLDHI